MLKNIQTAAVAAIIKPVAWIIHLRSSPVHYCYRLSGTCFATLVAYIANGGGAIAHRRSRSFSPSNNPGTNHNPDNGRI